MAGQARLAGLFILLLLLGAAPFAAASWGVGCDSIRTLEAVQWETLSSSKWELWYERLGAQPGESYHVLSDGAVVLELHRHRYDVWGFFECFHVVCEAATQLGQPVATCQAPAAGGDVFLRVGYDSSPTQVADFVLLAPGQLDLP